MKISLFIPYQEYSIDSEANFYGKDGKIMKQRLSGHGYKKVEMWIDGKKKTKMIHRLMAQMFLSNYNEKLFVDHINRNKLDNRIENLRMATNQQNLMNRPKQVNNTSGYKGIFWDTQKKKWMAKIVCNLKQIYIGFFDDIEKAREAYNEKSKELFGEFAYQEPPIEKLKIKFIDPSLQSY